MANPIGAFLQLLVANHIHGGREKFPGLKEKQETCNVCKHIYLNNCHDEIGGSW
jgi:hypothetical protein